MTPPQGVRFPDERTNLYVTRRNFRGFALNEEHPHQVACITQLFQLIVYNQSLIKLVRLGNGLTKLIITREHHRVTLPEVDPATDFRKIVMNKDEQITGSILLYYKEWVPLTVTTGRINLKTDPNSYMIVSRRGRFPDQPTLLFHYRDVPYYKIIFVSRFGTTHVKYKRYFMSYKVLHISIFDFGPPSQKNRTNMGTIIMKHSIPQNPYFKKSLMVIDNPLMWIELLTDTTSMEPWNVNEVPLLIPA